MNTEIISIVINILSSIIYDGMKSRVVNRLKNAKEKINEENIKNQVAKNVDTVLQKKVTQSSIFDCDAMNSYLKNMKPIENIYQHVFAPEAGKRKLSEKLINELMVHTVKYLKETGKKVNTLDEQEIKEFYANIMDICDKISSSLLESKEKSLARLLSSSNECSEKRIVSSINETEENIRLSIEKQSNQMETRLQKITEIITSQSSSKIDISNQIMQVTPYKYIEGSEKEQCVKQITSTLKKHSWIHIYGKMFAGKTQVLIRVAERLGSYIWLNIRGDEFLDISLEVLNLSEDVVVIIDGIPNMNNPAIRDKCLQILSECKSKNCKLITSGYEKVDSCVKGFVDKNEIYSLELLGLTKSEIKEIMKKHQAPEAFFSTKAYQKFVDLCKELPPIVMEVVYRMKENGWKYDDDVFMTILTRKTEAIEEQMKYLFLDAIEKEDARRLYYRIIYANCPVEKGWIQSIASIPNPISQPDRNIELLKNRWLYCEGNLYQCPNTILQSYAEEQLKSEEKKAINKFLINEINKRSIDLLDITNLLLYFNRLEEYDSQGILCIQLMEQLIEHNVKEYTIHVENFWKEMPIPEKMSSHIRVLLRVEQLYYKIWRGETINDYSKIRNEIWEIAQEDELCKMLIAITTIRFISINPSIALDFFEDYINRSYEITYNIKNIMSQLDIVGCINLPKFLENKTLFVIYNQALGLYIDQLEQLEQYVYIMESFFIEKQWIELENIENLDALILCMLEKVWKNSEDSKEQYLDIISRFFNMLDVNKTPILWKSVFRSYLVGVNMVKNYTEAKKLYCSVEPIVEAKPIEFIVIIDMMARIAHDNLDREYEKQMFKWEMEEIVQFEASGYNSIMLDSALLYLEQLASDEMQEIEKVHETMKTIACNITPQTEYPYIKEKVEAEYWMKMYLVDQLERKMSDFLNFVEQLLQDYEEHDNDTLKSILTKMCHVLGYISSKLLRANAPSKFPDGSEYASPKLRMFWNDVDDLEVIEFWETQKREMMYFICAELADRYGLDQIGNRMFEKMISRNDFWNNVLGNMYMVDSYMQFKFLEQKKWDKLIYVMQKMHENQERVEIEKSGIPYFLAREQLIFSVFILKLYQEDKISAINFCEYLIVHIDENKYDEIEMKYYKEYKNVLGIIINEDADFDLLSEAFFLIQKKSQLTNMDSGIFPLLLLEAPSKQKESLKHKVVKSIKQFHFDNEFMMDRKIKMIESI